MVNKYRMKSNKCIFFLDLFNFPVKEIRIFALFNSCRVFFVCVYVHIFEYMYIYSVQRRKNLTVHIAELSLPSEFTALASTGWGIDLLMIVILQSIFY